VHPVKRMHVFPHPQLGPREAWIQACYRVVTREERYDTYGGHSEIPPRVNDGDPAQPRVSIHVL
jgi:hypothetical protein